MLIHICLYKLDVFKSLTPYEQAQRDGGLVIDINEEFKYIGNVTLESLEMNEARCRFNEKKLTVKVGTDSQEQCFNIWINGTVFEDLQRYRED